MQDVTSPAIGSHGQASADHFSERGQVGANPETLLRAAEGFGFLLVVLPAPGWVRSLVEPERASAMMGLWGAYMPLATALALLLGPLAIADLSGSAARQSTNVAPYRFETPSRYSR